MAEFRQVHCKTWRDDWFSELDTDEKLLWLYLITNQATSVSGIYQLPRKFIAFETGLHIERVTEILEKFKGQQKIDFDDSVIWVCKMREYQSTSSDKVATRIKIDVDSIPNCRVKGIYCRKYGIDTVSIPIPELSSDTDTDTDTETEIETEIDKKQKRNSADKPRKPPIDKTPLLIETTSKDLQASLIKAYSGKGRSAPLYFSNEQQRDQFSAAIKALDGQSAALIDKGLGRDRLSLAQLLAWLEACVKNQNGNGDKSHGTNQRHSEPDFTAADIALAEEINARRAADLAAAGIKPVFRGNQAG